MNDFNQCFGSGPLGTKIQIILPHPVSRFSLVMYSAHCQQPGETSKTNPGDDQDLTKRRREKEGHGG